MLSCHKLGRKPSPTRNEKAIIFKSEVRNITKCSQAKLQKICNYFRPSATFLQGE